MPANSFWLAEGTTLSDQAKSAGASAWAIDPVLAPTAPVSRPRFLRAQWDEPSAEDFGPWRFNPRPDPAASQSIPPAVVTETKDPAEVSDEAEQEPQPDADRVELQRPSPDPELLKNVDNLAFKRGFVAGRQQELAATQKQRDEERELIRNLSIELRALQQDPSRLFEPLKKLALHLAEALVRNELQTSPRAINSLMEACVNQLDTHNSPVTVSLNPVDLRTIQSMGEAVRSQLNLVEDAQLRAGSVRARVGDAMVEDLIEHRLEALARKMLADPDSWLARSSLVSDATEKKPDGQPAQTWQAHEPDVVDVDSKASTTESSDPEVKA